ncbi:MAG TPA: peptidoglycan editing factor PgeF [Anaerovoracaceae bacterium]|nr:peptidoglycan editing factor PgeF [Anaerovoracaceae bacterium]
MKNWKWENNFGIPFITIPAWRQKGVEIAFTTRRGGFSSVPYHSLNLGLHVGDKQENVINNRQQLLKIFGGHLNQMVCCQQVHGNIVKVVEKSHSGSGAKEYGTALEGIDGMICNTAGIFLTTFYADCLPVYLFDPIEMAIGIAHSGWKGTIKRIAGNMVAKMAEQYSSRPENLQVFFGPGIGACCFEIQSDLVQKVNAEFGHIDDIIIRDERGYKWDLIETNRIILRQEGIKPENIYVCDICTSCNPEIFYSYRSEKGKTGRMGAIMGLRN